MPSIDLEDLEKQFRSSESVSEQERGVCLAPVPDATEKIISKPPHYTAGSIECLEYIFDQGFGRGFCLGNAIKYITRAGLKSEDTEIQDLMKAREYLDRYIKYLGEQ